MWLVAIYQEDLADDNSKRWYVFKGEGGYFAEQTDGEGYPVMVKGNGLFAEPQEETDGLKPRRLYARNGKPYKTAKGIMRRVEAVYDPSNGCYHRNACKGGWTFVFE